VNRPDVDASDPTEGGTSSVVATPPVAHHLELGTPEIDQSKVGLSLISVVYGIVLGEAFLATLLYNRVLGVSWSKLAVATTAIVLSYIGFYNNRDEYPVWKARFVNIPFLQYLLSIATLAAYWGLVAAAQGVEVDSVRPEAVLVAAVFAIYLCWDGLQMLVQRSEKYQDVTRTQVAFDELNATGPGQTTYALDNLTNRTIARRNVTLVFVIGTLIMGGAVWYLNPTDLPSAVAIDALYCLLLLLYRLVQERQLRSVGPAKLLLRQISRANIADELQKFVQLRDAGAITDDEFQAQKDRLLPPS